MKRKVIFALIGTAFLMMSMVQNAFSQRQKDKIVTDKSELARLKVLVEKNLDSPSYHKNYIAAMGIDNPDLVKQYNLWMSKFPKNATIPYAIAEGYLNEEDPKARPYLLKAVEINPKYAQAWGGLWIDGERWGDFKTSGGYLKKATEADPSDPNYAFYYANSITEDQALRRELLLDVAKRFPNHNRGAQALYWLAYKTTEKADKIKYYQILHDSFDPAKFSWSATGTANLFDLLLSTDPDKALQLAKKMEAIEKGDRKQWPGQVRIGETIVQAKNLIDSNQADKAHEILKTIKLFRYSSFLNELELMKARAIDRSGKTSAAYDSLLTTFSKTPKLVYKKAIESYGAKLGKTVEQCHADIMNLLSKNAVTATPFEGLKRYMSPGQASLSDFKGKVVLLTYWFPGCGPCRAEFPHFENVVRKFKGQNLEYVGLNVVPKQNPYVIPFMKSSGYSFTPLEDIDGRVKGNLNNFDMAPVNFLIDSNGKLYFSKFRVDEQSEEDLELMISLLLNKNA